MGHLFFVPLVLDKAGKDSWLSLLLAMVPGLISIFVLSWLALLYPEKSLDQIARSLFGGFGGKLIALIYSAYFLLPSTLALRGLMEFMGTAFLSQTPKSVTGIIFLVLCGFAVKSGLENIVRAYTILMPVLILMGILAAGLASPEKEYQQLLPVLEHGLSPVLRGAIPLLGLLGELAIIGVLQGSVKESTSLWKYNLVALLLTGIFFIGPLTGPVAMFGEQGSIKFDYPTFAEMKFGSYLVDFQSLAVLLWLFGSFGRIAGFYYASTILAARVLGKTDYRSLILPMGLLIYTLALFIFPDLSSIKKFIVGSYPLLGVGIGIILPTILLLTTLIGKATQGNSWRSRTN